MTNIFYSKNRLAFFKRNVKVISVATIFLFLNWKCISPPDFLGGDLLPEQDELNLESDTSFTLSAFTQSYDTISTTYFTDAILGETLDDIFGHTRSSFVTQFRLGALEHSWGTNPTIDSVVFTLKLKEKLGDAPMHVDVFDLTDSLSGSTEYNAFDPIENYDPDPKGSTTTPYTGEDDLLKIYLDNNWVMEKLVDPTIADTTIMSTQEDFLEHFYGFYVKPSEETSLSEPAKGMYYFDFTSIQSRLMVYYKNDELESDTASLSFSYVFTEEAQRYNQYEHNFDEASDDIGLTFNPPDDGNEQDSVFYVKGLGGAMGVIVLDDILEWSNKMPIAISRAELRIEPESHDAMPKDTLLNQLFAFRMDDNQRHNIEDFVVDEENFGGKFIKHKGYYSFNITHHLQSLLNSSNPDDKLYIEGRSSYVRANNVVLRSGNHPEGRIKLVVTYINL
ncbi:MAG: DUF4270 family protein [Bacteroidales bacterium]